MLHEPGKTVSHDEQKSAIIVARWLTVALPQDLVEALDRYAASLGPETTAEAAIRRVLYEALLGQGSARPPAV
jgi:hypothetical protein